VFSSNNFNKGSGFRHGIINKSGTSCITVKRITEQGSRENNYLNHFEKQNPVCNDEDDPQGGDSIYENDEFEVHNKLSLNHVIVGG
jgi:hypothetical protein